MYLMCKNLGFWLSTIYFPLINKTLASQTFSSEVNHHAWKNPSHAQLQASLNGWLPIDLLNRTYMAVVSGKFTSALTDIDKTESPGV